MSNFLDSLDLSTPLAGIYPASRVGATEAALDLLDRLWAKHGGISLHHAGGVRDGAEPLCLMEGELRMGEKDILLGDIHGVPVYVSGTTADAWEGYQFILDAVQEVSEGFSLVGNTGWRFVTLSRPFSAEDRETLGLPVD